MSVDHDLPGEVRTQILEKEEHPGIRWCRLRIVAPLFRMPRFRGVGYECAVEVWEGHISDLGTLTQVLPNPERKRFRRRLRQALERSETDRTALELPAALAPRAFRASDEPVGTLVERRVLRIYAFAPLAHMAAHTYRRRRQVGLRDPLDAARALHGLVRDLTSELSEVERERWNRKFDPFRRAEEAAEDVETALRDLERARFADADDETRQRWCEVLDRVITAALRIGELWSEVRFASDAFVALAVRGGAALAGRMRRRAEPDDVTAIADMIRRGKTLAEAAAARARGRPVSAATLERAYRRARERNPTLPSPPRGRPRKARPAKDRIGEARPGTPPSTRAGAMEPTV